MVDSYEVFKDQILKLTTIDLNSYKERQMKRRIDALITKHNIDSYSTYVNTIKTDKVLYDEFVTYLTINVSEFYRNPEQWQILEKEVYPYLTNQFGKKLKIWSAACSTGDEPYSLVMLLSKFLPLSQIKIIATDIDKQILEKAQCGLYSDKSLKGLPQEFVTKYFTKINDKSYKINDEIKKCVEFRKHDLLKDSYPDSCDLIVCRNVLIYFTEEAKIEIYKKFNNALKREGILFVGSTE
ncbi:CheR family methyltransferase, partial [Anaerosporobacter sp.]